MNNYYGFNDKGAISKQRTKMMNSYNKQTNQLRFALKKPKTDDYYIDKINTIYNNIISRINLGEDVMTLNTFKNEVRQNMEAIVAYIDLLTDKSIKNNDYNLALRTINICDNILIRMQNECQREQKKLFVFSTRMCNDQIEEILNFKKQLIDKINPQQFYSSQPSSRHPSTWYNGNHNRLLPNGSKGGSLYTPTEQKHSCSDGVTRRLYQKGSAYYVARMIADANGKKRKRYYKVSIKHEPR